MVLCAGDSERYARRAEFAADGRLISRQIVELVADPNYVAPPLLAQYVKPDEQIVRLLVGDEGLDSRLAASCRVISPKATLSELAIDDETKRALIRGAREQSESGTGVCLWLFGPDGTQQGKAAEAFAREAVVCS